MINSRSLDSVKKSLKPMLSSSIGTFCGAMNNLLLKNALTIFLYHDVSSHPSEFCRTYNLNVYPEIFEYQIDFIKNNFNMIGPDELLEGKIPSKAAMITFDDGMRSFFTTAVPILEKHKIPSIIFLNMEPIKGRLFWAGLITYLCQKKNFINYVEKNSGPVQSDKPLYLSLKRDLVERYLREIDEPYEAYVEEFVGPFATESDLAEASLSPLVYYGNHLFNHEVPRLLSDNELLRSYATNMNALKQYPNYRNMFSFPYGQPGSCFSEDQVDLLFHNGVQKIFSAYGVLNSRTSSSYLHRIPLSSFNETPAKIWFQICNQTLRNRSLIFNQS